MLATILYSEPAIRASDAEYSVLYEAVTGCEINGTILVRVYHENPDCVHLVTIVPNCNYQVGFSTWLIRPGQENPFMIRRLRPEQVVKLQNVEPYDDSTDVA